MYSVSSKEVLLRDIALLKVVTKYPVGGIVTIYIKGHELVRRTSDGDSCIYAEDDDCMRAGFSIPSLCDGNITIVQFRRDGEDYLTRRINDGGWDWGGSCHDRNYEMLLVN